MKFEYDVLIETIKSNLLPRVDYVILKKQKDNILINGYRNNFYNNKPFVHQLFDLSLEKLFDIEYNKKIPITY